jgi:hypothetical protein
MFGSGDAVRCTVQDGAMWMQFDNASVKIPPKIVNKNKVLMDTLSVTNPSITGEAITLPAPKEWLQAWAACYCNEEEILSCEDINLVNCLLVCFLRLGHSPSRQSLL